MVLPSQLAIELTYFWCIWFMIYIILSLFVNMDLRDLLHCCGQAKEQCLPLVARANREETTHRGETKSALSKVVF